MIGHEVKKLPYGQETQQRMWQYEHIKLLVGIGIQKLLYVVYELLQIKFKGGPLAEVYRRRYKLIGCFAALLQRCGILADHFTITHGRVICNAKFAADKIFRGQCVGYGLQAKVHMPQLLARRPFCTLTMHEIFIGPGIYVIG